MINSIYHVYISSVHFIRQNIFIVWPYFLFCAILLLMGIVPLEQLSNYYIILILAISMIVCLIETYMVVAVYVEEGVIETLGSLWRISREYFSQSLLLLIYSVMMVLFLGFIVVFFDTGLSILLMQSLFPFVFYGFFALGLRHKIFYNTYSGSGVAGIKHLFSNVFFYILLNIIGIIILAFVTLAVASLVPFVALLFYPFVMTLLSISLTYAFILETKKYAP